MTGRAESLNDALDVLAALVLEDGRLWAENAYAMSLMQQIPKSSS